MNEVARLEGEALDTDQAFGVELRDHDTLYGGVGRVAQHEPPRTLSICRRFPQLYLQLAGPEGGGRIFVEGAVRRQRQRNGLLLVELRHEAWAARRTGAPVATRRGLRQPLT